ncbi:hypothetical protein ONS95_000160 [Cadophora gregata]|uniref:uncharacterized protein n=1 Tax=Cadophora gregata TaxID=51156 RepID=UPI0026DA76BA|nr:uncharacterized protein ONS95_000160 [Cadophora gregata]KAK0115564.1 hypothetical protein ONS96_014018 [Cadophora gregata f. sp. sojae]KAK0128179.1 hypothetical protein ONS95_000160 [Cadophora gregata]
MSAYSASIYSVDEDGVSLPAALPPPPPLPLSSRRRVAAGPFSRPTPPLPHFIFPAAPSPPRSRPLPHFVYPASPPAPAPLALPSPPISSRPPPPPTIIPRQSPPPLTTTSHPSRPAGSGPHLADFFIGGRHGTGLTQLSDIARLADETLSAIEKHSKTGTLMGSIKTMLHHTPEFVAGLKELAEMVKEVARAVEELGFLWGIELFRVHGSLGTTLKALRSMTFGLFAVVSREKKLPKLVRAKVLEYSGKLHYELERLVRGFETLLGARLVEYEVMLKKIKDVRSVLRKQEGIEDPRNA